MITRELQSFGAEVQGDVNKRTTHVVVSNLRARTQKVRAALKIPHIKVVSYGWLQQSYKAWKRANENDYLIENHSPAPLDPNYSNADSDDESDGGVISRGGGDDEPSGSQETVRTESEYDYDEDIDGILPDEANSPIDDLKTFNWGEVDDELAEFMGSDADDDSEMDGGSEDGDESMDDADSTSSTNRKRKSAHISSDPAEQENSDKLDDMNAMSKTAKKQRRARIRSSGLKTVKNIDEDMESGLPTPEVTGGEEGDAGDGGTLGEEGNEDESFGNDEDDDLENMLENEMFAELANEDTEDIG